MKAVMEENNGKVTMSSLQNMQYLERCIKESLRLYPSVPFISRCPEMNMRLSNYYYYILYTYINYTVVNNYIVVPDYTRKIETGHFHVVGVGREFVSGIYLFISI